MLGLFAGGLTLGFVLNRGISTDPSVDLGEMGKLWDTAAFYWSRDSEDYSSEGRLLYVTHCGLCHGTTGSDGRAADLTRASLTHGTGDLDLFFVIRRGIPGTEMPRFEFSLSHTHTYQIVAYLRALRASPSTATNGDAVSGEQIFRTKGNCLQCHVLAGEGGFLGPELTEVGARRAAGYLRTKLVDPGSDVLREYAVVEVTTLRGAKVRGVRVNEDSFSVQIRDLSGVMRSFWKDELAEQRQTKGESLMPSYQGRLSDRELDDLVAYLSELRGER